MAASQRIPIEVWRKIRELHKTTSMSSREIAKSFQPPVNNSTVLKYWDRDPVETKKDVSEPEAVIPDLHADIRKRLSKQPMTAEELSDALDCGVGKVRTAIDGMRLMHINVVDRPDGKFDLHGDIPAGGKSETAIPDRGDGWQIFGFTSDNHLCNKNSRLDVLNTLYDIFEREGCTTVYNGGNFIDGEARFNRNDLLVFGMDRQIDYFIDNFPQRKGITTEFITGDDHEGWYAQRECINIGEHVQDRAERAGRHDLKYLSNVEHDIAFRHKGGVSIGRVMHPGGGSAYAYSYTSQKIVESFQGGEKPAILLSAHFHKMDWCTPRGVHVIQTGCTEDQTTFMRKKKLEAHVGGGTVRFKQDEQGAISRLMVEYIQFFDRKYYQRSFE